jgi:hypothetical protein
MKLASARSSLASAPFSTTKREPDSLAATSKSIRPSASPISKCCFGSKSNSRGLPSLRTSTLAVSSGPTGTSSAGTLGMAASASSSSRSISFAAASASGIRSLIPATSPISASARASSFAFLASPISFDAALRRSCNPCSSAISPRRFSSSATRPSAWGSSPRLSSALSKASGLSRIQRMSCMGESNADH